MGMHLLLAGVPQSPGSGVRHLPLPSPEADVALACAGGFLAFVLGLRPPSAGLSFFLLAFLAFLAVSRTAGDREALLLSSRGR